MTRLNNLLWKQMLLMGAYPVGTCFFDCLRFSIRFVISSKRWPIARGSGPLLKRRVSGRHACSRSLTWLLGTLPVRVL